MIVKLGEEIYYSEDYVKELQEENEYSSHCNEELRKKITNLEYKIKRLENELRMILGWKVGSDNNE